VNRGWGVGELVIYEIKKSLRMKDLEERIKQLPHWMFESKYLVVFTGAGISTESGLPDFRGPDGIWTRQEEGTECG
jgi:hypothetical protein